MIKQYSHVLVALLRGIVYSDNEKIWNDLIKPENEADVKKYFSEIFLEVVIDRSEGYAFLKQRNDEDDDEPIPKLIDKRQLNYHLSLLCLLLRKHLIETDRDGGMSMAVLPKEDIILMSRPFYKTTTNEAQQQKQIEASINRLVEEGFLRRLKSDDEVFEVNRVIKAFVNADTVLASLTKIQEYVKHSNP